MSLFDEFRLDRSKFSVGRLHEPSDEKAFWLSKSPEERLTALEYLRQVAYGYDPDTTRLQRVLEIAQREPKNVADRKNPQ
ncbi:MAG TPA: hypothetical protein PLC79_08850 [Phycisphaerae bacterium]|nr:hypothetical protein [Phycisphaerae bacterium]